VFLSWLARLLGGGGLGVSSEDVARTPAEYRVFRLPEPSGGARVIARPSRELARLQRRILRRLLARLTSHPAARWRDSCAATGFERGKSVVTNALPHARKAVVVRLDVRDFFGSTTARRPRRRNAEFGRRKSSAFHVPRSTFHVLPSQAVHAVVGSSKRILADFGYRLHQARKLSIMRRHRRQVVTGLVVNDGVGLPRKVRRLLRAVEHRLALGRQATLSREELMGWRAYASMVERPACAPRGQVLNARSLRRGAGRQAAPKA
jgi:arginyl-tRNA--protein-N-Asp/Glu arginylyltransferase